MPRVTAGTWRARVCGSKRGSRAHNARRHGRWREAESPEEDFALGHFQRSATLKRDPAGGACVLERASRSARWLRRKRGQRTVWEAGPPALLCVAAALGAVPPASLTGQGRGAPRMTGMLRRRQRFRTQNAKSSRSCGGCEHTSTLNLVPCASQRRGLRCVVTRQGCVRTRTHARAHAHTNRRSNTDVLERPPAKHQCFTARTRSPRPGEEAASRRRAAGTVRRACKRARAGGGGPSGWGVFSRGSTLGKYSLALTAAYKRPLHSAHRKMSFQE